ncbi:MAG: hypothetical protein LC772_10205 [Chloroflexi bacterium]|nr:hypothetical protein [Chloroflexota bacterium]
MRSTQASDHGDTDRPLPPQFSPRAHPHLTCRAHSPHGQYGVLYLGGESYWMHGLWTIQAEGRVVVAKNRLFQVSEMACAVARVPLPEPSVAGSPNVS